MRVLGEDARSILASHGRRGRPHLSNPASSPGFERVVISKCHSQARRWPFLGAFARARRKEDQIGDVYAAAQVVPEGSVWVLGTDAMAPTTGTTDSNRAAPA